MNELILASIVVFVFFTNKFAKVYKNKETPKNNKKIAWALYGVSVIGIIILNVVLS